jgi:hypothetical protein
MQERREVIEVTCQTSKFGPCVLTFDRLIKDFKSTVLLTNPWINDTTITNNKDPGRRIRIFKTMALGTWKVEVHELTTAGRTLRTYILKHGAHSPEQGWEIAAKTFWEAV